jgi:hypothetical protein
MPIVGTLQVIFEFRAALVRDCSKHLHVSRMSTAQ